MDGWLGWEENGAKIVYCLLSPHMECDLTDLNCPEFCKIVSTNTILGYTNIFTLHTSN
jgi:hypothetical protein